MIPLFKQSLGSHNWWPGFENRIRHEGNQEGCSSLFLDRGGKRLQDLLGSYRWCLWERLRILQLTMTDGSFLHSPFGKAPMWHDVPREPLSWMEWTTWNYEKLCWSAKRVRCPGFRRRSWLARLATSEPGMELNLPPQGLSWRGRGCGIRPFGLSRCQEPTSGQA